MLSDREEASVRRALEAVAAALLRAESVDGPGVARGAAGMALVHAALDPVRPGHGHGEAARRWIEQAVAEVSQGEVGAGLFEGLAGIAWAIERFKAESDDPNAVVDELLLETVEGWADDGGLDLTYGLSGVAVFAAERMPSPVAERTLAEIVRRLEARAEPVAGGVAWLCDPEFNARQRALNQLRGRYNLGVAHGQPGVLAALALAGASGVEAARAERLLRAGLAWFLKQGDDGGAFPSAVSPGEPADSGLVHAWCYGSAGVGAFLQALGRRRGASDWAEAGARLLAAERARSPQPQASLGLCHGVSSGVGLLGAEAAGPLSWAEVAPRLGDVSGEAGADGGLLMGLGGRALVLARALGSRAVPWERLFLADFLPGA